MSLVDRVRGALEGALDRLAREDALGAGGRDAVASATSWTVERPKRPEHGDLTTNAAMVLAKPTRMPPRAIADALVKALAGSKVVAAAEIAGPGFVNLRLHPAAFHAELDEILRAGAGYGRAAAATGERVNLEFVSANPTGPINVASGRNAIYGDTVGRLLEAAGHRVTREYYINDFGNQIRAFADSVAAVAKGEELPEDGYRGEYVRELADFLNAADPGAVDGDRDTFARACVTWMLRGIEGSKTLPGIRRSLADLGIHFDVWFSEASLHRWGAVQVGLRQLERRGFLVKKDGAVFFTMQPQGDAKAPDDEPASGDAPPPKPAKDAKAGGAKAKAELDKDRVVQKSDGTYTYFASDVAYQADKVGRGYDRIIIVLGADHHGYVPRVRNSLEALGLPSERFEALLYQLVYIYKGGELLKSSKRAGNFVTIEEVADEIDEAAGRKGAGADAIRFFFLSRSANSNVEFDIDLAKKKSLDNPVFYVQYGYARLSSILRKAESIGIAPPRRLGADDWAALAHPDELAIAARIAEFPELVAAASASREPHRLTFYLQELAREFQSYFTRLKTDPVLPQDSRRAEPGWEATWDHKKTAARLAWIEAIRIVYAAGLALLGVSAPERMDRPVVKDAEAGDDDAAP